MNNIFLLLCISMFPAYSIQRNNVCKTFGEYFLRAVSQNCWYNPDVTATAPDLIMSHGYPLEIYEVITEDFYILQVFRIPPKNKNSSSGTVFLEHPLGSASPVWIDRGNTSLAFLLADAEYDVWLGNFRGTIYSDKHVYLSSESNKYWNFSFHEYGKYDLPAQLELVKKESGNKGKIFYVGHSIATSAAFVYSSLMPEHAKEHIQLFVCMSPIASLKDVQSPIVILAPFTNIILRWAEMFHVLNILPFNGTIHTLIKLVCNNNPGFCAPIVMSSAGEDWKYADPSLYPVLFSQNFAGFSLKVFAHLGQIYNAGGRFQLYDYGNSKNQYYYHTKQPPMYPVKNISVPMYFIYGGHDIAAIKSDVIRFYNELPSNVKYGIKNVEPYNHLDFLYAKQVVEFVYEPVIKIIREFR